MVEKSREQGKTIAVITACLNEVSQIGRLMDSLNSQTDKNFSWFVADGGSTDGTLDKIKSFEFNFSDLVLDSAQDQGIYSALNRAVQIATCDYYLVVGADDYLYPTAIETFGKVIHQDNPDLVVAPVMMNGQVVRGKVLQLVWLYGSTALVPSHAVGTLINRKIHDKHGLYDESYKIYADGDILLRLLRSGCSIIRVDLPSGEFSTNGLSNRSQLISFSEQFRAQVATGSNYAVQLILFCLRLWKWRSKITASWSVSPAGKAERDIRKQSD